MPFLRTCEECNKSFEVGSRVTKGRFCSKICTDEWQLTSTIEERYGEERAKRIRENMSYRMLGNNPNNDPKVIQKKSESVKRFLRENPESRLGINNPFFGKKHTKEYCEIRSKERKGKRSYNDEQSKRQKEKALKGKNHPLWKNGASETKYTGFTRLVSKKVRERDGHLCVECNKTGKNGLVAVHHIDYNKNNPKDDNLITLCPKCHGITNHGDRDKWINYFREKYQTKLLQTI
jgi:5-methylcytosine-specific restriction endonuclease McrA